VNIFFLNQQNKRHFGLYEQFDRLNWRDQCASWADVMLSKRSDLLNRRTSKISPRRGKKHSDNLAEEIAALIEEASEGDLITLPDEAWESLDDNS
jgi:hypothetical protein